MTDQCPTCGARPRVHITPTTLSADVTDEDRLADLLERYAGTPTTLDLLRVAAAVGNVDLIGKLSDDCDRLRAALQEYGRHLSGCALNNPESTRPCTCGLDDARDAP